MTELFDLCILPGVRTPACTGILNNEIHSAITIQQD